MSTNHPGSFAIYLRRLHEPPSAITLSSVLQRVPPHHPPPPRPFWYRLRPTRHQHQQHNQHQHQHQNTNRHQPAAPIIRERPVSPPPAPSRRTTTTTTSRPFSSPAVIFDASILVQPAGAATPAQPRVEHRQRPRLQGLLFRLPYRKSVSMSSLSRHEQSRSVLSDVMSLTTDDLYVADRRRPGGENYRTEEETKQEAEVDNDQPLDEESASTTSSSVIRVFTSSWSEQPPRARSAPPATAASCPPTNPTRPPPPAPQQQQQQPRPYSDEQSEQSFWVRADLEPGIVALHGSYSGRIVQRSSQPPLATSSSSSSMMIYVTEQASSLYSLPTYIGKLRGWYTEIECREIFRNMCRLVRILHKHRTVHRNLHLNQFLVNPNTGEFSIRGIFDAAYLESRVAETSPRQYYTEKPIHPDHKYRRRYDWFAFRSPELDTYEVSPRHGTATDVWSMGVCLYTLLTGIPPFRGSGRTLRHSKMTAQTTPYEVTAVPSAAAQDLIARMIVVNPTCRLTMKQVLAHPWMQNSFATDVDLSLTQTLFMDWDNRGSSSSSSSSHRRRPRSTPRRPSSLSFTNTDSTNTSSRIVIRGT